MTVFKGYMKILKKNIGLVIIYLVIFSPLPWLFRQLPARSIWKILKKREWILPLQIMIRVLFLML